MPTWLTVILALGGSATITAIVNIGFKHIINRSHRTQNLRDEKLANDQKERDLKLEESILTKIKELILPINNTVNDSKKILEIDKLATITCIRTLLKYLWVKYKNQGFADIEDKCIWNELYNSYKDMGGNHFKEYVDEWKEEVNKLPNKDEK